MYWCLMLYAWCLILVAWCLMLDAWCLMLDAWCLMLDAWTPARPIHKRRRPSAALRPPPLCGTLCGWVWQVFKHQASSIKHQASSIKHQASSIKHQASSIKHLFCHQSTHHGSWSTFDETDIDYVSARVFFKFGDFQNFRFPILTMLSLGVLVLSIRSKIG